MKKLSKANNRIFVMAGVQPTNSLREAFVVRYPNGKVAN